MEGIKVVYASNFNGVHLIDLATGANIETEDPRAREVIEAVADFADDFCDDSGHFGGNIDQVEVVALESVIEHFGDVNAAFEEDSASSLFTDSE